MAYDDYTTEELAECFKLLDAIAKLEAETVTLWTDLDELKERFELLSGINKLEGDVVWTSLDELRERADLLAEIAKGEDLA